MPLLDKHDLIKSRIVNKNGLIACFDKMTRQTAK